ncbi:MAG: N-acetylmuramoyl-L-alanine amidase [Candidatus Wallbacteria bacterium]
MRLKVHINFIKLFIERCLILLLFVLLVLNVFSYPAPEASAGSQNSLNSHKVDFNSDNIKLSFYFSNTPQLSKIESVNKLEYIVDFLNCDFIEGNMSQSIDCDLIQGFKILKSGHNARVVIRQLKLTQVRVLKGFDKTRKRHYVALVFYMPYESYSKFEARISEIEKFKKSNKPVVVIDAGHGGKDPGAKSLITGEREKDLNLKVAREVCENINSTGVCQAYLTRTGDQFYSLSRRVYLANQYSADAFISIHFNANHLKKIRGFETYYITSGASSDKAAQLLENTENASEMLDDSIAYEEDFQVQSILIDLKQKENIKESGIFAEIITRNLSGVKGFNVVSPKQANFAVLRNLNMPSILIEVAYLSNSADMTFLRNSDNFEEVCARISLGIINFVCSKEGFKDKIASEILKSKIQKKTDDIKPKKTKIDDEIMADSASNDTADAKTSKKIKTTAYKTYVVKNGDTIIKIAKKFKMSPHELAKINGKTMENANIAVGEKLKVRAK